MKISLWVLFLCFLVDMIYAQTLPETNQKRAELLSQAIICKQPGRYIGWPTVSRGPDGDLLAVFSGDRQYHSCPFGKVMMIRSKDEGRTWTRPEIIADLPIVDDRDAGVMTTGKGTILVSWFTSIDWASDEWPRERYRISSTEYEKWKPIIDQVSTEVRNRWYGNFIIRSEDNGTSWSEPIRTHGTSPHGPIQLSDGRLMHAGLGHYDGRMLTRIEREKCKIGIEVSYDDGRNWQVYSSIPLPDGECIRDFNEPHIVEDLNGKLYVFIRHHVNRSGRDMWYSESTDGGKSWTIARDSGIHGFPPHLLCLKDGRIVLSYGYRRSPHGQRAIIIDKDGKWDPDDFVTLSLGHSFNLGYPTSVQLDDGSIYTVYYQEDPSLKGKNMGLGGRTVLMGTHWRLKD